MLVGPAIKMKMKMKIKMKMKMKMKMKGHTRLTEGRKTEQVMTPGFSAIVEDDPGSMVDEVWRSA